MYGCTGGPNDHFTFGKDGTLTVPVGAGLCVGVEQADPAGQSYQSTLQAWVKPLKGADGVAVLLINPTASAMKFDVPLNVLPLAGSGASLGVTEDVTSRVQKAAAHFAHQMMMGSHAQG